MQLSEQTDVALRVLMYLELNSPRYSQIESIYEACNTSRAQVVKATQTLRTGKFIRSRIGRRGGFALALPAKDIRIGDVVRLVETRIQMAECFQSGRATKCPLVSVCRLKCVFEAAMDGLLATLDQHTLRDVTENREELMKACFG